MKGISLFLGILLVFNHLALSEESESKPFDKMDEFEKISYDSLYPRISDKYRAGNSLIYDCLDRHFACVNGSSFYNCTESREKSIKDKRAVLTCAPLKQFNSLEECTKEVYRLIHYGANKKFCLLPISEEFKF